MKTKQTIVAVALSSVALFTGAVFAGSYPTNPERDVIDQSNVSSVAAAGGRIDFAGVSADGWKDVGGERGDKFVGGVSGASGVSAPGGDAHAYMKEELMQAHSQLGSDSI